MNKSLQYPLFAAIAVLGAISLGIIALNRGETVNAVWILTAALCTFAIAYRFYSLFIARKVLQLDPNRRTPAVERNDGLDYVPTNKYILYGHHFAAIAGAGPLVGPVLASQMGFLPGTLWILVGVVFAGAVQDFMVLFISTRRDGRSLGDIIKSELGPIPGTIASIGVLLIMIIILAVLALVVVKALAESPWGTFTLIATIPIAILMGVYLRFIRPGRVAEMSIIGFVLLMLAIVYGEDVAAHPTWGPALTFPGTTLALMLIGYGFVASVLPVWFLLAPRDYLSTFLKVGFVVVLALGILIVRPDLQMPALTKFIDGTGPVFSGALFPFLFITIACGAVSGFHALISSGTTPKMLENETHARFIGYGGMLTEAFVAIMALISACILHPGVFFAMNAPASVLGTTVEQASQVISGWGFVVSPEILTMTAREVGESSILSRAGGAPTLAVGMAQIMSELFGSRATMGFWYHFAILFEALFILTAIDAGTRVGRFMIQDLLGGVYAPLRETRSWASNLVATTLCVGMWGYILYQGVIDPFGGINTLWPLFGISNQMLAAIALTMATVVLFKMKRERYAWVTAVPTTWLLICTLTAGLQKLFHPDPRIGFLSHARKFSDAIAQNQVLAPAKDMATMQRVVFNDYLDAGLCALFVLVVLSMIVFGLVAAWRAFVSPRITAREVVYATCLDRALAQPAQRLAPALRHPRLRRLPGALPARSPRGAGDEPRGVLPPPAGTALRRRGRRHALLLTRKPRRRRGGLVKVSPQL